MAKRWMMSPVIGTGTEGDPYRAKLADYGIDYVAVIASNADGTPRLPWCVCRVSRGSGNFADLDADAGLDAWPAVPLDTPVSDLTAAQRNRLRTALERHGIDTSDVTGQTPLRAILRRVAQELDANFDEARADVSGTE